MTHDHGRGQRSDKRSSWHQALLWALAHAVNDGYPTLYLAVLPVLMHRWHFTVGQAGLLAGLLALTTQALQPVFGWWADQRGGPWFIVGGLLAGSLGNAIGLAWAPSYAAFAVALMVGGLGNAAFHPHMAALVTQTDQTRKGRQMSGWMVSGMIGHALAPIAAVAAWNWGGQLGMAMLAVPGLLAAGSLYKSARSLKRPNLLKDKPLPIVWRQAWRRARPFLGVVVLRNLGSASLLTLLPILWHIRGGALNDSGLLLAAVYSAGMVGNLLGGALSDHWGSRVVLIGSLFLAGIAAVAWGVIPGTGWTFWIAVAAWGFSVNGAGAVILVYGQGLFPGRSGMASGLTMGLGNTVGAFGAWVIGSLAQSHGMAPAVTVAAGCLWLGLIPIFLMRSSSDGPRDSHRRRKNSKS